MGNGHGLWGIGTDTWGWTRMFGSGHGYMGMGTDSWEWAGIHGNGQAKFLACSQFSLSLPVLQLRAEESNPKAGIPRQSNPCTLSHHISHIFGIWTFSLVFHHLCWQTPELGMWGLLCPHLTGRGRNGMGFGVPSNPIP